jgi:hypothetical protein
MAQPRRRNMRLHTTTCTLLSLALLSGAGCESTSTGQKSVLGGLGAGGLGGGLAKALGADTEASLAIGAGVGLATAVAINIIEERRATEEERRAAQEKANKQLEPVKQEERQELKDSNTYVAVPVGEDTQSGQKEVMVVDPVTGEPVNDTVYVVDASDPGMDSREKVDLGGYDAIYVE